MTLRMNMAPKGAGRAKDRIVLIWPKMPQPVPGNPNSIIGLRKTKMDIPTKERKTTRNRFEGFFHASGMVFN